MMTELEAKCTRHPHSSDGIVLGLSRDRMMMEISELARLKLAALLRVDIGDVTFTLVMYDGKMVPEIQVDNAEGLTADQVKEVIQQVWWGVKIELEDRVKGLEQRRAREEEDQGPA